MIIISSKNGMSLDMYNFIIDNEHRLQYDLDKGLVITPRGTNGTLCSSTGYLRVKVNKKTLQVHQILAVKYFKEECIGMQVNHKDGNKTNNTKNNLELLTLADNVRHAFDIGLAKKPNPIKVAIDKLDLDGSFICRYNSIEEAYRDVGLMSDSSIRACLKGYSINGRGEKRVANTAKGFRWRKSIK